jgi:putative component of toxin-antitoxin plasmid stabilization module
MLGLRYYETAAGRSEPAEYLSRLPERVRGRVLADIEAYRLYGVKAPISWKPIAGSRPMMEIRVAAQRVYYVVHQQTVWILQIGPKGHQARDIEKAVARMKHVRGG